MKRAQFPKQRVRFTVNLFAFSYVTLGGKKRAYEDVEDTYNGTLLSLKKRFVLPFATTWMDLENIMRSKISQTEKVKNHMISLIHGL